MTDRDRLRTLCYRLAALLLQQGDSEWVESEIRDCKAALRRMLGPADCCQRCGEGGAMHEGEECP